MDDQQTNAEMIDKLAKLPLAYQPGIDVRVRHVERRGRPHRRGHRGRGSQPVHRRAHRDAARDDGHGVPARRTRRPRALRSISRAGRRRAARVVGYNPAKPPKWFSGGGGLLSTAEDYARFCQMLLNGGELDGVRLLSRKSVELDDQQSPAAGRRLRRVHDGARAHRAAAATRARATDSASACVKRRGRSTVPGSVGDYLLGRRDRAVLLGRSARRSSIAVHDAAGSEHAAAHALSIVDAQSGVSGAASSLTAAASGSSVAARRVPGQTLLARRILGTVRHDLSRLSCDRLRLPLARRPARAPTPSAAVTDIAERRRAANAVGDDVHGHPRQNLPAHLLHEFAVARLQFAVRDRARTTPFSRPLESAAGLRRSRAFHRAPARPVRRANRSVVSARTFSGVASTGEWKTISKRATLIWSSQA